MELPRDFEDLVSALSDAKARFLVVGGHAVITYSKPRYTKDLDIWVGASAANAKRVVRALEAFGAPAGLTVEDFSTPGTIVMFGRPPMRVDILTAIAGVPDFDKAWRARIEVVAGDVRVPIIGLDDLIANKAAINDPKRPNDKADLKALRAAKRRRRA